jgi:hypothetical protein
MSKYCTSTNLKYIFTILVPFEMKDLPCNENSAVIIVMSGPW